jgi:hypothetical protein
MRRSFLLSSFFPSTRLLVPPAADAAAGVVQDTGRIWMRRGGIAIGLLVVRLDSLVGLDPPVAMALLVTTTMSQEDWNRKVSYITDIPCSVGKTMGFLL